MKRKYKYYLNGILYFIYCTEEERFKFERLYGVALSNAE
jgi:hypothetical protein